MPSRAPLTDEEMQLLRDRMERYEAAKSTRTPPPAPSQTFGMQTHSARRTGPRQRYDPQAAAEARHADRMRLAELRKTVEADKETRATAQKAKRKKIQDEASPRTGLEDKGSGTGLKSGAFYSTARDPSQTTVAQDYAAANPQRERPISSMYSVTPSQYAAAYGVPFTGSDPDSMRRLLALQNGTGSAMNSERMVMDQQSQDAFDNRPANPNPPAAFKPSFGGLSSISEEQQGVAGANQGKEDSLARQEEMRQERARAGRIADLNAESISERYGIPPVETMSQMMDPDSPMATGPGRKGLVKRKR